MLGIVIPVADPSMNLEVEDVLKRIIPFFLAIFAALMFITYIPAFSLWLPGVLGLLD